MVTYKSKRDWNSHTYVGHPDLVTSQMELLSTHLNKDLNIEDVHISNFNRFISTISIQYSVTIFYTQKDKATNNTTINKD